MCAGGCISLSSRKRVASGRQGLMSACWCAGRAGVLALDPSPKRPFLHTSPSGFSCPQLPYPCRLHPSSHRQESPLRPPTIGTMTPPWQTRSTSRCPVSMLLRSQRAATCESRSTKGPTRGSTTAGRILPIAARMGWAPFFTRRDLAYDLRLPFFAQ